MSDNTPPGFAKFVPGFDFLQNIAKGAAQNIPQLPNLSNWIAPTLNVEELEKRITELKAVHFWLEQNSKALGATIQALEVQKMTLSTLQGMNFSMGDVAEALKLKPDAAGGPQEGTAAQRKPTRKPAAQGSGATVDPLQWWGALTQQFQEIAAGAMQDVVQKAADTGRNTATGGAEATKGGTRKAAKAPRKTATRKTTRKD